MRHPEAFIQKDCVTWFRKYHKNELCFSVPNEAAYSRASHYKELGMLKGVADLVCVLKGGRVVFVEFKSETGSQKPEQRAFETKIKRLGFEYHVVRSLEGFKNIINNQNEI